MLNKSYEWVGFSLKYMYFLVCFLFCWLSVIVVRPYERHGHTKQIYSL